MAGDAGRIVAKISAQQQLQQRGGARAEGEATAAEPAAAARLSEGGTRAARVNPPLPLPPAVRLVCVQFPTPFAAGVRRCTRLTYQIDPPRALKALSVFKLFLKITQCSLKAVLGFYQTN